MGAKAQKYPAKQVLYFAAWLTPRTSTLFFGLGIGHKLTKEHEMHGNVLFDQPVEDHAAMRGVAPVEAGRKSVSYFGGKPAFILLEDGRFPTRLHPLPAGADPVHAGQFIQHVFAVAGEGTWLARLPGADAVDAGVGGGDGVFRAAVRAVRAVRLDRAGTADIRGLGDLWFILSVAGNEWFPHPDAVADVLWSVPRRYGRCRESSCVRLAMAGHQSACGLWLFRCLRFVCGTA